MRGNTIMRNQDSFYKVSFQLIPTNPTLAGIAESLAGNMHLGISKHWIVQRFSLRLDRKKSYEPLLHLHNFFFKHIHPSYTLLGRRSKQLFFLGQPFKSSCVFWLALTANWNWNTDSFQQVLYPLVQIGWESSSEKVKILPRLNPFCPTDIGAHPRRIQRTYICFFAAHLQDTLWNMHRLVDATSCSLSRPDSFCRLFFRFNPMLLVTSNGWNVWWFVPSSFSSVLLPPPFYFK